MSMALQCFSIEDLEPLDEDQLQFLRLAVEREIRNSLEVKQLLRTSVQALYDRMLSQSGAARSRRTGGGRRPRPRRRT